MLDLTTLRALGVVVVVCLLAVAGQASAVVQGAIAYDAYPGSEGFPFANLHTYGAPVVTEIAALTSYTDVATKVVDVDSAPGDPKYFLGSTATVRAGTNTDIKSIFIFMAWRNRTDIEYSWLIGRIRDPNGAVKYPAVALHDRPPLAYDSYNIVSDVVDLAGVSGPYVLEMDYVESELIYTRPTNTEELFARGDWLYLGWLDPGQDPNDEQWKHATAGNIGPNGAWAFENYQGSYDDFMAGPGSGLDPADYLGSYGVDITDDTVWAVLDHSSVYGVVPEPASLALLVLGGRVLLVRRRRKK